MADHQFRRTGRTVRRIARYVVDLLAAPGVPLTIMDHFDNRDSHRSVQHQVSQHLKFLGVDHEVDTQSLTITVKPMKAKRK